MKTEELAALLYERYCVSVGGLAYDGKPLPGWGEFRNDSTKRKQSDAWVAVAEVAGETLRRGDCETGRGGSHVSYVAGFMFALDLSRVALIRKKKPVWQSGKLNGIGGKREPGETANDAMAREFWEETGCTTTPGEWEHFCEMGGQNDGGEGSFHVDFFTMLGDVNRLQSMESEKVELISTREIHVLRSDMIENLPWLIALALDYLHDGRPEMVRARYGVGAVKA